MIELKRGVLGEKDTSKNLTMTTTVTTTIKIIMMITELKLRLLQMLNAVKSRRESI